MTPLHLAAQHGSGPRCSSAHVDCMGILLRAGAQVAPTSLMRRTPLHLAALMEGGLEATFGADDAGTGASRYGERPGRADLGTSTDVRSRNHLGPGSVIALLVEAGAPIDAIDSDGRTPLMLACGHDKPLAADSLLTLGAYPYARDGR